MVSKIIISRIDMNYVGTISDNIHILQHDKIQNLSGKFHEQKLE